MFFEATDPTSTMANLVDVVGVSMEGGYFSWAKQLYGHCRSCFEKKLIYTHTPCLHEEYEHGPQHEPAEQVKQPVDENLEVIFFAAAQSFKKV